MRLAEFILQDMEAILREWESFAAAQLPAAAGMTRLALRDHAKQILLEIASDLKTSQTKQAQEEKSKGKLPEVIGTPETAAEIHAVLRAQSGFDINQLVAEYRALRASVLRLWMSAHQLTESSLDDVVRFNEAIDQAIAESIHFFSDHVEQTRNLMLGMLGHDMRSPLSVILTTAAYLEALDVGTKASEAIARLVRGGNAMKVLLDDLVDFNRIRFGLGMNIELNDIDIADVFVDEIEQLRAANPSRRLDLDISGDTRGSWDGPRLQQLLRNLVLNAIKYGVSTEPVRIVAVGDATDLRLDVTNYGPTIDQSAVDIIFAPLTRGPDAQKSDDNDGSLGLGLYIVREVARAHGGEVGVVSEAGETVFSVRLPRRVESLVQMT